MDVLYHVSSYDPHLVSLTAKEYNARKQSSNAQVETQVDREVYIPPYPYLLHKFNHTLMSRVQPERKSSSF
jgi:hypothetical protein